MTTTPTAKTMLEREAESALTKLAAECHRAKWQFDFSDEHRLAIGMARDMVKRAFSELHRIGDEALKARDDLRRTPAPSVGVDVRSPTLGSSIDLLIGLSFKYVETLNPDAKHRYYRECGCCGGTDENRDHYKPDIQKVEHKNNCPLARDLPLLRSIGLSSDASFRGALTPSVGVDDDTPIVANEPFWLSLRECETAAV